MLPAATNFGHVQTAKYLDDAEREQLLAKVDVTLKDTRVDKLAKNITEKDDPTKYVVDGMMGEKGPLKTAVGLPGNSFENDRTVDWLKSVEASGQPGLIDKVLTELESREPGFVTDLLESTKTLDPDRAARLTELLSTSERYGGTVRNLLAAFQGALGSILPDDET